MATQLVPVSNNALTQSKPVFSLAVVDAQIAQWTPVMREMVVAGRKLNDDQIKGRLMFAMTHGLDPVTEVHTITDKDGKTMSHTMGINGLRRKNQEQAGQTTEIMLEFAEMAPEALKKFPGSLIGYECRLRDGQSYTQWQRRMVEIGKAMKEAGVSLTYQELIQAAGPAPVYTGVGIFYQNELSEYKDKNFNPVERCKKRAEVNARHHRWPTETPIFDGEDVQIVEQAQGADIPDAQPGEFRDAPPARKPEAQLLSELGFGDPTPAPKSAAYTREDAAAEAELVEPEFEPEPQMTLFGDEGEAVAEADPLAAFENVTFTRNSASVRLGDLSTDDIKKLRISLMTIDAEKGLTSKQVEVLDAANAIIKAREA